jgi:phosphoesterase RecJ-like protein
MNDRLREVVSQRLASAQKILIASHVRPDGDAVGALLGLGLALQEGGKSVQMVLGDGVPGAFRDLPGARQITRRAGGIFDLVIVVDCSDLKRVGGALDGFAAPELVVDHHVTNLNFAPISWVEPTAAATCEILARNLPALGFPISQAAATALLAGIISDTLGFRTSNMTSDVLRLAADLMDRGANLPELYQRSLVGRSLLGGGLAALAPGR